MNKIVSQIKKDFNQISDLKIKSYKGNLFSNIYIIYLQSICSSNKINDYVLKNLSLLTSFNKNLDNLGNALPDTAKVLYGNLDGAKRATDLIPTIANKADIGSDLARIDKGRLQSYKELKDSISDVFKKSKVSKDAILTKRAAENTANEVKLKIGNVLKQNEDIVKEYSKVSGKDLNKASENISLFIESLMDRSIEKDELLDLIRKGKVYTNDNIEKALKEMQDQIINQVSKISNIPVDQVKSSLDLSFGLINPLLDVVAFECE